MRDTKRISTLLRVIEDLTSYYLEYEVLIDNVENHIQIIYGF